MTHTKKSSGKLVNGLQFLAHWQGEWHMPGNSAISREARTRLGAAPMKELFDRVAVPIARPATTGAWFHGRRVMAVDGVIFDVADEAGNVEAFGRLGG